MEAPVLPHHNIDCCCLLLRFTYSYCSVSWQASSPEHLNLRDSYLFLDASVLFPALRSTGRVYNSYSIHPTVDEHGGCSRVGAIVTNAMKIQMQALEIHTCMCAFLGRHAQE